ncbi:hypothetical protein LTR95_003658 [Oleoguttula sp. CCFEE 5521]
MSAPVPLLPPTPPTNLQSLSPRTPYYLTVVYELHPSSTVKFTPSTVGQPWKPIYTFSLDRLHTTLQAANTRLTLLSRSNTIPADRDVLRAGVDEATGGWWCSWTRRPTAIAEPSNETKAAVPWPRFCASVRRIVMHGDLLTQNPIPELPPTREMLGSTTLSECRYLFERRKDLAHHVWVVAVHQPARVALSASAMMGQEEITQPWRVESIHPVSGNALARAKRLWTEGMQLQNGSFDRVDFHYGAARYILLPASTTASHRSRYVNSPGLSGKRGLKIEREPQIRVERIKVYGQGEMVAWFAPAEAIVREKVWRPLCPGREARNPVQDGGMTLPPLGENLGIEALERELDRVLGLGWDEEEISDVVGVMMGSQDVKETVEDKKDEDKEESEREHDDDAFDWQSILDRGDFSPPADYQQSEHKFRTGVVSEYGKVAAEPKTGQQDRLEEIVNKAQNSRRWSHQALGLIKKASRATLGKTDAADEVTELDGA